jgi:biotin synthase
VLAILQKANLKQELSRQDIITLLNLENPNELKLLYETANNIRQRDHDNACCVHGILEFSNNCSNDCHYCGIRRSMDIPRYRMSEEEMIIFARYAIKKLKFKAIVLQSGEDGHYTDEMLARVVSRIRRMGALVFVSIGVRKKETYKRLYDAGARAILLRFETSDRNAFSTLRPGTSYDERIELIKYSKSLGYLVATGFMIGLPGETHETIADNILLTKQLGADMHSFGPLIPAAGTPLEAEKKTDMSLLLKTIAISRLVDRNSKILVTTAMETLDPSARKSGLLAGGNSVMLNITPKKYRRMYAIYPARADKEKMIKQNIDETTKLLYSIGRAPTDIGL